MVLLFTVYMCFYVPTLPVPISSCQGWDRDSLYDVCGQLVSLSHNNMTGRKDDCDEVNEMMHDNMYVLRNVVSDFVESMEVKVCNFSEWEFSILTTNYNV